MVAVALIEVFLRPARYGGSALLATPKQSEFLADLGHEGDSFGMSRSVASAWMDNYLRVRTMNALRELHPKAGDLLRHLEHFVDPLTAEVETVETDVVVSSVGSNGLVYFKGGHSGWPTNLVRER